MIPMGTFQLDVFYEPKILPDASWLVVVRPRFGVGGMESGRCEGKPGELQASKSNIHTTQDDRNYNKV